MYLKNLNKKEKLKMTLLLAFKKRTVKMTALRFYKYTKKSFISSDKHAQPCFHDL